MKLSEAAEKFKRANRGVLAPGTITTHEAGFTALIDYLGDKPVTDITRDDLRAWRGWLLEQPRRGAGRKWAGREAAGVTLERRENGRLSLATIHGRIRSVKRLFSWLEEERVFKVGESPAAGLQNVTLPQAAPRDVEIENAVRMIETAARPPSLAVYQARAVAICSLIRRGGPGSGELSRLRIGDIQWNTLHLVGRNFPNWREERQFTHQMNPAQMQALYDWLAVRPLGESDQVFVTLDGRGERGAGGGMGKRAIYSVYHAWKNRSEAEREVYQRQLNHEALHQARRLAVTLFLADTGARAGGVCSLTWERLDLARQEAVVIEKGRGGGAARPVFFGAATAAALAAWEEVSQREYGASVFGLSQAGLTKLLDRLAAAAGVEGAVNPHAWRHGFAKWTLLRGGDLATVSQLMGHSSIRVTADHYARFATSELKKAHGRLSPVAGLVGGDLGGF